MRSWTIAPRPERFCSIVQRHLPRMARRGICRNEPFGAPEPYLGADDEVGPSQRLNRETIRRVCARNHAESKDLPLLPTDHAGGRTSHPAEVSGKVALVGKPRCQCDL